MFIPRLNISFSFHKQLLYWFGKPYQPNQNEVLLNHARSGLVLALQHCLPNGGRVGVLAYDCHTVMMAIETAGCTPVFIDVDPNLRMNLNDLSNKNLDALIVTNLFGIHNDISTIKAVQPNIPIIVDNAHGGGLPVEGDFTVYSINQGKFPVAGPGGVLVANDNFYLKSYNIKSSTITNEIKVFCVMLIKAFMHIPIVYSLITKKIKSCNPQINAKEQIKVSAMPMGVQRVYACEKQKIDRYILMQRSNADYIISLVSKLEGVKRCWYGENAFMLLIECEDVEMLKQWFYKRGIETDTHFKNWYNWAQEFGYVPGSCPAAEKLVPHLLMVPTYKRI